MKNAVAYEWIRARSLRSTWLLLLAAGVLQFASGLYWGLKRDLGDLDAFTSSFGLVARLGALLVAAVGVAAFGLDFQHGTLATTRLVLRSPVRIVAARAVVTGGLGLLGGVLMVVLAAAGVLAAWWGPARRRGGGGPGHRGGAAADRPFRTRRMSRSAGCCGTPRPPSGCSPSGRSSRRPRWPRSSRCR